MCACMRMHVSVLVCVRACLCVYGECIAIVHQLLPRHQLLEHGCLDENGEKRCTIAMEQLRWCVH
jgi:hypothetical protein